MPAPAPTAPSGAGRARRPARAGWRRSACPPISSAPRFADDVAAQGTYAALTRALALQLPAAPELPSGAGEVLFVVGPGVETLRAARALAASLRLDPDRVQWATRGDLAGLAPKGSRMTTVDTAIDRRQDAADVRHGDDRGGRRPAADRRVLDVADAGDLDAGRGVGRRRGHPQARGPRARGSTGSPGSTRSIVPGHRPQRRPRRRPAPGAPPPWRSLDGVRATPHRWASLLCERLESTKA